MRSPPSFAWPASVTAAALRRGSRRSFWRQLSKPTVAAIVVLAIAAIGALDWATGIEVRIFPLYFLPLAFAAQRLGTSGALSSSLLATISWISAQYLAGREYSTPIIWLVNFCTQGSAFLVVSLLVARLELRLRREHRLSRTDALTGLLNSRAFRERARRILAEATRRRQALTFAYLDLDHFKQVNDRDGHDAGDRLLERIAQLLTASLGAEGIVARVGGDEFAVLLPGIGADGARQRLEALRTALLTDPEVVRAGVSASIGGISLAGATLPLDELIRQADALMYTVKTGGRNAVRVDSID